MEEVIDQGRRTALKIGAAVGGGLLVGFQLPGCKRQIPLEKRSGEVLQPNAWLRIGTDDSVTIMVGSSEMGQGVMTAIPMLVAEELEADWSKVRAESAPALAAYTNPLIGQQLTGGSTTVRAFWTPVREAGAVARELLIGAAAQTWGVAADRCWAENGSVRHKDSDRRLSFGALAPKAATLPVPTAVILKDPNEFRLLGKATPRLDVPDKVDGSAIFGQDVRVEGMLIATVLRSPTFGGRVVKFDATAARAVKGVQHVVQISSGVAVVARGFWSALKARDLLKVEWDIGASGHLDSAGIQARLAQAAAKSGIVVRTEGDALAQVTAAGGAALSAVYEVPYLAHACMEPMNCTAHVRRDSCDVWVPTQAQTGVQRTAARITGLAPEVIKVHTTMLGGGFGRRSEQDFVAEAVELSKAIQAPVKVLWTREDDMRHDFYRPATYNRLSAVLGKDGLPVAWMHHIVGPSIMSRVFPTMVKDGIDRTSVEGAANLPYAIPHLRVSYVMDDPGVPVGFWRSVGSSQNAFITECFVDELAAHAHADPYQYRRKLLHAQPRHLRVLDLAAERAGWGHPLAAGRSRGIAIAESFGTYVAQVAEVSVSHTSIRVHRVVCAVDCGMIVNPDTVEAQMQSAIVYGLTAALTGEITLKDGQVEQGNFDSYPLLRMHEMPQVEVYRVASTEPPGGVGEPGTPPIAPAVANAVYAATGKAVRRLPIRISE
jgi:isoquinoline 1-oxidoreductase beta subunit